MKSLFFKLESFVLLCFLFISFVSCNGKKTNWNDIKNKVVSSNQMITDLTQDAIYIDVDDAEEITPIGFMKKFVKTVEYIPIKPKDPIGAIDYILIESGRIFVLDIYISRRVFIFDRKGNFINYAGDVGQGPREYIAPEAISIIKGKPNLLAVCDRNLFVNYYDFDGNFIKKEKRFFGSYSVPYGYGNKFFNSLSYGVFNKELQNNFQLLSTRNNKPLYKGFQMYPIHKNTSTFMNGLRYNNEDLLFTPSLSDTTYVVKNDSLLEVKCVFKHRNSIWKDKYLYKNLPVEKLILDNDLTKISPPIIETNQFISFVVASKFSLVSDKIATHQYWYDKNTKRVYKYGKGKLKSTNNTITNPIANPISVYGNSFITYFSPEILDNFRKFQHNSKIKILNKDLNNLLKDNEVEEVLVLFELE